MKYPRKRVNRLEKWLLKHLLMKEFGINQVFYNPTISQHHYNIALRNLGLDKTRYSDGPFSPEMVEEYRKMGLKENIIRLEYLTNWY